MNSFECRYYKKLDDGAVECELCPHHCHIADGKTGLCRSRRNHSGLLLSEVYARPCALAIDPIEKKPLYHFHPGPEALVALCQQHHCPGIAYTYTEPLTYLEYITDCARLAHEAGLWNILVTAGYVCQQPLADLLPYLDAANIDLKSFSDDLYRRVSGGRLQPVLDTILAMRDAGVWIELTNLIIPQLTDNLDMIRQMCRWLVDHHLADAPLHFSRFFPRYRLPDTPPTPLSTLRAAQRIALDEGIQHVYLGNV